MLQNRPNVTQICPQRIPILPNLLRIIGIILDQFLQIIEKSVVRANDFHDLIVGNFIFYKGYDQLLVIDIICGSGFPCCLFSKLLKQF